MKLTFKQKKRKAQQMMSSIEKVRYHTGDDNQVHHRPRTPLFQSRQWLEKRAAAELRVQKIRDRAAKRNESL